MPTDILTQAIILGLVEGVTEFLPISSTGHLILLGDIIGFKGPPGRVFEIAIQFGAILAVVALYAGRLLDLARRLPRDPSARRFVVAVTLAFVPAAVVGVVAHRVIKEVLFQPTVVCLALIWGGVAILLIERWRPAPRVRAVEDIRLGTALIVGLAQCLAMIPGTSRSAATIMGAMLAGVDRRAAAEFSFYLAMPTMLGATVYDLYKNRAGLDWDGVGVIALGFAVAFLAAALVVRGLLAWLARRDFTIFGWYRIMLGAAMLAWFAL
jgi:undecaprenyl-diphosphatase